MKTRLLFRITHRDMGYTVSGLLIVYCISGLALNHVDEWNPDFIIEKRSVRLPAVRNAEALTAEEIGALSAAAGEKRCKLYDSPSPGKVKLYFENATLLADFTLGTGSYEGIRRRPLFYQVNILHRNSLDAWKWMADIFALVLILITVTGMLMNGGRQGLSGRGKWFLLGGVVPPIAALILFELTAR